MSEFDDYEDDFNPDDLETYDTVPDEPVFEKVETKLPKEALIIALFGLIVITSVAVAGQAYNVIVNSGSTDGLTTIAAVGIGGLVAALGAHQKQS